MYLVEYLESEIVTDLVIPKEKEVVPKVRVFPGWLFVIPSAKFF